MNKVVCTGCGAAMSIDDASSKQVSPGSYVLLTNFSCPYCSQTHQAQQILQEPSPFDQTGQTVLGTQTNIAKSVTGSLFTGMFYGPVTVENTGSSKPTVVVQGEVNTVTVGSGAEQPRFSATVHKFLVKHGWKFSQPKHYWKVGSPTSTQIQAIGLMLVSQANDKSAPELVLMHSNAGGFKRQCALCSTGIAALTFRSDARLDNYDAVCVCEACEVACLQGAA